MAGESPDVVLYDKDGNAIAVQNGVAIPASTPAILTAGSDGTNSRYILVDSSGRPTVVGPGIAGTPAGGVLSIQGVVGGTVVPISGIGADNTTNSTAKLPVLPAVANTLAPVWTDGNMAPLSVDTAGALRITGTVITSANPSVGTNALAIPTSSTQFGGSDGTNLQAVRVFDLDSSVLTTQYILGVGLRKAASGGSVEFGTLSDPIRIDPTGTTTQPVSGTVTANQGGAPWSQNITQFGGVNISTGTGASGTGIPRVTVANDSNILATQSGTWTVAQGTAAALSGKWPVQITDGTNTMPTGDTIGRAIFHKLTDGTNTATIKAASTAAAAADTSLVTAFSPNSPLPTGSNVIGAVTQSAGPWTENLTQINGNAVTTLSAGEQKVAVEGLAAAGAAISGNPVQIGGKDPSGNAQPIALAAEQSQYVTQNTNRQVVHSNATITTSSNTILSAYGNKEISLFINIKNSPTGTTPTLTFTIQEVDPGDLTTVLGTSTTGVALSAIGTQILTLSVTKSGVIKVSWTITGASASFTGVYVTLVTKLPGAMIGVDSNGTQHPLLTDTSGNLNVVTTTVPSTALQEISIGKILMGGAVSNVKFAVRRTTYTEQTTGAQRSMSSSSASDTSAGTGARTVKITYFTSDLVTKKTETITMNGTTAVNTTNTDICFIEKMEVITVGSNGANVGTITLFTTTGGGGGAIGTIAFSTSGSVNQNGIDNRTYWAHHYVAVGKTCTVVTFDAGTQGNQNAEAFLSSNNPLSSTTPDVQISDSITVGLNAGTTPRVVPNTIKVSGPARVTLYLIPAGNGTAFYGSFDYWEA